MFVSKQPILTSAVVHKTCITIWLQTKRLINNHQIKRRRRRRKENEEKHE